LQPRKSGHWRKSSELVLRPLTRHCAGKFNVGFGLGAAIRPAILDGSFVRSPAIGPLNAMSASGWYLSLEMAE
jgi:hypothetical protein